MKNNLSQSNKTKYKKVAKINPNNNFQNPETKSKFKYAEVSRNKYRSKENSKLAAKLKPELKRKILQTIITVPITAKAIVAAAVIIMILPLMIMGPKGLFPVCAAV